MTARRTLATETLVQSVLLRPKMYTVTGSLSELLAFFNGCLTPERFHEKTRDDGSVDTECLIWLTTELGIDSDFISPERIYDTAIAHFGDERSTINATRKQFLESFGHCLTLNHRHDLILTFG